MTPRAQTEIPRDERAYHEAGHVALFLEFDRPFIDVTVVAGKNGDAPGVRAPKFRDERLAGGAPDSIETKKVMLILLAGMAAERIWLNEIDRPFSDPEIGSGDYFHLDQFYKRVHNFEEDKNSPFYQKVPGQDEAFYCVLLEAQKLLGKRLWRKVQSIANELMTHDVLTYDEVNKIIDQVKD